MIGKTWKSINFLLLKAIFLLATVTRAITAYLKGQLLKRSCAIITRLNKYGISECKHVQARRRYGLFTMENVIIMYLLIVLETVLGKSSFKITLRFLIF